MHVFLDITWLLQKQQESKKYHKAVPGLSYLKRCVHLAEEDMDWTAATHHEKKKAAGRNSSSTSLLYSSEPLLIFEVLTPLRFLHHHC